MEAGEARARFVLKCLLLWQARFSGQAPGLVLAAHVAYIFGSTWLDARRWLRARVDALQLVHHVATWWLLWVLCAGAEHSRELALALLGAVDHTDAWYYLSLCLGRGALKTGVQLGFVFVWAWERLLVWGPGGWGWWIGRVWSAALERGAVLYVLWSFPPVAALLATNVAWTWKIGASAAQRLGLAK